MDPSRRFPLPGLLIACLSFAPVAAGEWITFEDGRVLRVQTISQPARADGHLKLELESGGALLVPASSIRERVYSPDPPSEPVAVPAVDDGAWKSNAGEYADLIERVAAEVGLEPALLAAVGHVESRFDAYAVSHAGACGILQLMPETAQRFDVRNVFDPEQNVAGGARYLRWLIDRFDGDLERALAGYNAGEGAVDRYGGIPPYRETRRYVKDVLAQFRLGRTRAS